MTDRERLDILIRSIHHTVMRSRALMYVQSEEELELHLHPSVRRLLLTDLAFRYIDFDPMAPGLRWRGILLVTRPDLEENEWRLLARLPIFA